MTPLVCSPQVPPVVVRHIAVDVVDLVVVAPPLSAQIAARFLGQHLLPYPHPGATA